MSRVVSVPKGTNPAKRLGSKFVPATATTVLPSMVFHFPTAAILFPKTTPDQIKKNPQFQHELEEKKLLAWFSPFVTDVDIGSIWAEIRFDDPTKRSLAEAIVLCNNIAYRGSRITGTSDVAMCTYARFGPLFLLDDEDGNWIKSVKTYYGDGDTGHQGSESHYFCQLVGKVLQTSVFLAFSQTDRLYRTETLKSIVDDVTTKTFAFATSNDKNKAGAKLNLRAQISTCIEQLKKYKPEGLLILGRKFMNFEESKSNVVHVETWGAEEALKKLTDQFWALKNPKAEIGILWVRRAQELIDQGRFQVYQSLNFAPSELVLRLLTEEKQSHTLMWIIIGHIQSLMAFDFYSSPPERDLEGVGIMWPFWELEKFINLLARFESLQQVARKFSFHAVIRRWNLVNTVVRSYLGRAKYNDKWKAVAGKEYAERISRILLPLEKGIYGPIFFAMVRPREYPLASRPVLDFVDANTCKVPFMVQSKMQPVVAKMRTENVASVDVHTKLVPTKAARLPLPSAMTRSDMNKYISYMETTYLN